MWIIIAYRGRVLADYGLLPRDLTNPHVMQEVRDEVEVELESLGFNPDELD